MDSSTIQTKQRLVIDVIVREMDKRGLNQKKLAKLMDIDASYLSRLFKGRINLTLETILKFEFALQIEIVRTTIHLDRRARAPLIVLNINYDKPFKGNVIKESEYTLAA